MMQMNQICPTLENLLVNNTAHDEFERFSQKEKEGT